MNQDSHIGQYKIMRTLGAGGMGTVYLGEHILLGKHAAIKTLLPALSSQREIVERFFNEARAISVISDPGVVQVFDFGYHVDGTAYIVMEFLEGESLSSRIDRLGRLPLPEALRLARQIAGSLAAAHDCGIVHRDLKPGNVFVIRDPEAQGGERTKILDFGIAKFGDEESGRMLGTPVYMSPEQCRAADDVDRRSDIYSVGCALFHMLTGRPPFDGESVGDFIAAHLEEPPPAPSTFAPDLPPAVDALVLRCLAKSPDERFQSMTELQAELERILAFVSDSGVVSEPVPPIKSTPLSSGFHSAFDVNLASSVGQHAADPWFVDSLSVPASSVSGDWPVARPRVSYRWRFALLVALFAGLAGGLFFTSMALDGRDSKLTPAAPAAAAVREQSPPTEALAEPPAPVAPAPAPAAAPVAEADPEPALEGAIDTPTLTQDAPPPVETPKKVDRPPRPHVQKRPQPRRHVPDTTEDDLYETR